MSILLWTDTDQLAGRWFIISRRLISMFQKIFIFAYETVNRLGFMDNPWLKRVFLCAYFFYKKNFEDPFWGLANNYPHLFQGGNVLDIGANIGYTSDVFSLKVTPGYKIFSLEPDLKNFKMLEKFVEDTNAGERIRPFNVAVGDQDGVIDFWHNPAHHGDHRIMTESFRKCVSEPDSVSRVSMVKIDTFVEKYGVNPVTFIKIDVQGYELPVCKGMEETLAINPLATIAIEYCPSAIQELGYNPMDLLRFFQQKKYLPYVVDKSGKLKISNLGMIVDDLPPRGYVDLIYSREPLSLR